MTPGQAIRKFCLDCVGSPSAVKQCKGDALVKGADKNCPLFRFRLGKGRPSVKIIREHCLYCCNDSYQEIRECQDQGCPLYKFRMGKNPNFQSAFNGTKTQGLADSFAYKKAVNA